jgi:hypothetical protein
MHVNFIDVATNSFVPDIGSAKLVMFIRDQKGDEPEGDDPILGFWKGDFINTLLGKDHHDVDFKLYQDRHKPFKDIATISTLKLGFGFCPVKLDVELSDAYNTGILHLDILSAAELPAVDSNGLSDPYAIVSLNGKEIHKTKTKKKTLNPEWDEGLEAEIVSRIRSVILIEIKDFNQFTSHETLGTCSLSLAGIKSDEVVTTKIKLDGARSGFVTVRYMFEPRRLNKIQSSNELESRFKTETSSLGKFGRGLTSQVSGIGKGLFSSSSKSKDMKLESLPSTPPTDIKMDAQPVAVEEVEPSKPKRELPTRRPLRQMESSTPQIAGDQSLVKETTSANYEEANPTPSRTEVKPSISIESLSTTADHLQANSVSNSILDITLEKKASTVSINSMSSAVSHQSRIEEGEGYVIRILGAKDLKPVDGGGTSDPYVKVYIAGTDKNSIYKTSSQKKTLNPVWEKESFMVSSLVSLKFAIFDKNTLASDVPLGHVVLPLATVYGESDRFDDWYKVQDGTGTLHISGEIGKGKQAGSKRTIFSKRNPV